MNNSGIGIITEYEKLNNVFSQTQGIRINVTYSQYSETIGSDTNFGRLSTFMHYYKPLFSDRLIFGLRLESQLAVGDMITMTYLQTVVLSLNEPGEEPAEKNEKVLVRAEKGETPGGVSVEVHEISAVVKAYDAATGIVTLMGPRGNTLTTIVSDVVWASGIVNVGQVVYVRYTEALAISVEKDQGYYKAPKD